MTEPLDVLRGIRDRATDDLNLFMQFETAVSPAALGVVNDKSVELMRHLEAVANTAAELIGRLQDDHA